MVDTKDTIVLLEDNPHYGITLERSLLGRYGDNYNIERFVDPADAIERIKQGRVAAAIIDFLLNQSNVAKKEITTASGQIIPLQDGYRVMQEINRIRPETEQVMYTAEAGEKTASAMTDTTLGKFVKKTDDHQVLFETLDSKLHRYERLVRHTLGSGRGKNAFITGGSGFVGDAVINRYLSNPNVNLWILSRASREKSASDRILSRIDTSYRSRIVVLEGDLGMKLDKKGNDVSAYLKLDDESNKANFNKFQEMLTVVDEICHIGAYLSFSQSPIERAKLMDINIGGTQRVLNVAGLLQQPLEVINYISTAFVHGIQAYPHEFFEDGARPNRWINPYEETKWRAESLIKESGLPYRIFRPSVIVKELGANVLSDDTMYGVANVIDLAYKKFAAKNPNVAPHVRIEADKDSAHNFILRSDLVDMMFGIRDSDHGLNHVYNTVNPHNTKLQDLFYGIFNSLNPEITFEFVSSLKDGEKPNTIEALFKKMIMPLYEGYLFKSAAIHRMDNVVAALGNEYLERIIPVDRDAMVNLVNDHFYYKKKQNYYHE